MNLRTTRRLLILPGTVALAALAGCGGAGGTTASGTTAGGTTAPPGPAVGSTASAEVNPAGDIPDSTVFVAYTPPGGAYTVKVPEGWAKQDNGGSVTFTDKLNSVTLSSHSAAQAPTVASARTGTVPKLRASTPGFQLVSVSSVRRTAGSVVEVEYHATSAPSSVTGKSVADDVQRYEYYRNGTEVDVALSGPVGADNVDPWRTVTDSFRWA